MDTYFVNVTEKESQGKPVEMERDGGLVFCCCVQSVISLMKWSITRANPPGRAGSGSIGMDAVASGSFGFIALSISLVKSDWKLQQKTSPPSLSISIGFPFP